MALKKRRQPLSTVRFDVARELLRLAGAYYPGPVGAALTDDPTCSFDALRERDPEWLRNTAREISKLDRADPAGWERQALHLLAGDPVRVPSWSLAKFVPAIPPAPITWWVLEGASIRPEVSGRW